MTDTSGAGDAGAAARAQARRPSLARVHPMLVKLVLLAGLTLLMLIPLEWVRGVIVERAETSAAVERELGATWGGPQRLGGPILAVPFEWQETVQVPNPQPGPGRPDSLERQETRRARLYLLPETQAIAAEGATQTRRRGIYEALLYSARVAVEGSFTIPRREALALPAGARVHWDRARLMVLVTDLDGSASASPLTWTDGADGETAGETRVPFDVAGAAPEGSGDWIEAALPALAPGAEGLGFRFTLGLNGSRQLTFVPLADDSRANLAMDWPHPSFGGSQLPLESRVDGDGFTARWSRSHLARGLASVLRSDQGGDAALKDRLCRGGFATRLLDPVAFYAKTVRAVKYGLLFIVLTYAVLIAFEATGLRRQDAEGAAGASALHPVHYGLVGAALVLFFLLLLSLAEVIGFAAAYWLAAGLCLSLVTLYAIKVTASAHRGLQLGAALLGIYGYLFLTLRAEDQALLMGSLLLFAILAAMMYATRNVDWSALGRPRGSAG